MPTRITIRLIGSGADSGDIRLSDFIDQLEAVRQALRQTERIESGEEKSRIQYKIVGLSRSSPATVVLEPIASKKAGVRPSAVATKFVSTVRNLNSKRKPPENADLLALESYRHLGQSVAEHRALQRVEISTRPNQVVAIDSKFVDKVDDVIGPDLTGIGEVTGKLDAVLLHNALRFEIYPVVGPRRIRCEFTPDKKAEVKRALESFVTVRGKLRYKRWDEHPYAITVREIDTHPPDNELPDLWALRGLAPDLTADLTSEEFVRLLRAEGWES